jgi:aminopeptidase N
MLRTDYKAPQITVTNTRLDFLIIDNSNVYVHATYIVKPKKDWDGLLTLNQGLYPDVKEIKINHTFIPVNKIEYVKTSYGQDLVITSPHRSSETLVVSVKVKLNPSENTSLEGLYLSSGILVTQCESHGFRNIVPSFDTPDILSKFKVRIHSSYKDYPSTLSNGNRIGGSDFPSIESVFPAVISHDHKLTSHIYEDPFAKPSYLFAMVAGKLGFIKDEFITMNNKKVELFIYSEESTLSQCYFAMGALKRSMKHDEEFYNLEYDLDNYKIVAINDFNAGAMENKGLNVFNSSCILADETLATDGDFSFVDRVIAHEYFHNYTGNRVTLRDWFELTLKEGLTVYRDQEYSESVDSYTSARLSQISMIKNIQFKEDAGPMSHPIRPDSVENMSNFYSTTVYSKGAEIIRMIATCIGDEQMHLAVKNYLDVFDGQAVTCEDFIASIEDFTSFDLSQFRRWYSQNGTPSISLTRNFDKKTNNLHIKINQEFTSKSSKFLPFHIPFKVKFFDADNGQYLDVGLTNDIIHIKEAETNLTFYCPDSVSTPLISGLINFSAPVNYTSDMNDNELSLLSKFDDNIVNVVQIFDDIKNKNLLDAINHSMISDSVFNYKTEIINTINDSLDKFIQGKINHAALSNILATPTANYLSTHLDVIDLEVVYECLDLFSEFVSYGCEKKILLALNYIADFKLKGKGIDSHSSFDYEISKIRALRFQLINRLAKVDPEAALTYLPPKFNKMNFTDKIYTLSSLLNSEIDYELADYFTKTMILFSQDNKNAFSSVISTICMSKELEFNDIVRDYEHYIDSNNPNSVRSFVGCLSSRRDFHNLDGSGYKYITEWIIKLDKINPSLSARLISSLDHNKHKDDRKSLLISFLKEINDKAISSNVKERVKLMLK